MIERRDVEAALEARRELGREYEPEIVDAMVDRIEKRLDDRLRERERRLPVRHEHHGSVTPLVLGSIALGIPVTAVALGNAHGVGGILVAIVAWIAIAVANLAVIARR
jgi:hypothetical protein